MVLKELSSVAAIGREVISHCRFHGNPASVSDAGEVLQEGVDSGNFGVRFWETTAVRISELDCADKVGSFAHHVASFALHGEVIEVGGKADLCAIDFAGDGEGFGKGVEEVGFGVVDVFDGDAEVEAILLDDVGSHAAEADHLLTRFELSPSRGDGA